MLSAGPPIARGGKREDEQRARIAMSESSAHELMASRRRASSGVASPKRMLSRSVAFWIQGF
jgi:hypothetical protein